MAIKIQLSKDLMSYYVEDISALNDAIEVEQNNIIYQRQRVLEYPVDETEKVRLARALQRLGGYMKVFGKYAQAIVLKDEALEIWVSLQRKRPIFLCRLKRASLWQFVGRQDDALQEFNQLLVILDDDTQMYKDFILEERALLYFRRKQFAQAIHDLEEVLDRRVQRGHAKHIEQTRNMLEYLRIISGD